MEVTTYFNSSKISWKKQGLSIDILQINEIPRSKKPKLSERPFEDLLIKSEDYGISLKKGNFRKSMEDTYSVYHSPQTSKNPIKSVFALFDGHSGQEASKYASANLIQNIKSFDSQGLTEAFLATDTQYCSINPNKGGTTVALAILDKSTLICANVGDTKIILAKKSSFEVLSYDHVASDIFEKQRIECAGGYISNVHTIKRVCGQLAITRSIGDPKLKNFVIPLPYVSSIELGIEDLAVVLASDGIFETLKVEDVWNLVRENIEREAWEIADLICDEAITKGSKDNSSVLIIKLKNWVI